LKELAAKVGIGKSTLSTWVKQHQAENGVTGRRPLTEEQKQIAQLKKEIAPLEEVNEILKKATTYFATQSDRRGMSL
jgi:transposase